MKRFYREVTVEQLERGFAVRLDGRHIKTAAGVPQIVPSRALAAALAAEWDEQGEDLDPGRFHFRDLADYAIDIVGPDRGTALNKLLAFAETDTLCYRADPEEALYRRQLEVWEPLLAAFESAENVRFERVSGIIHRSQPPQTLAALRARLAALDNFTLAGLQTCASLAASLCIAMAVLQPDAEVEALWNAANLEELWQAELWGHDAEAQTRLALRTLEFRRGAEFLRLVSN
ncbi:ATP12 family chaperone protein [Allopontixanthobacter sp.]|uniref:ATP12 family chaperone protein n=1 Tax=Allopontixanthobacter sp. TaxID=2906452 RepID=UPI002AB9B8A8|nr:ATP12 family protein [Allopontixanthobacter sp.]MDZ4308192.1 ATP12 family protein [Allopontixanthobacter sp.]